jgi:hypothetical protein
MILWIISSTYSGFLTLRLAVLCALLFLTSCQTRGSPELDTELKSNSKMDLNFKNENEPGGTLCKVRKQSNNANCNYRTMLLNLASAIIDA